MSDNGTKLALKVVCYGDAGSGKSTFAATFPKPMVVFSFDPIGKDIPYLLRGKMQPVGQLVVGKNAAGDVVVPVQQVLSPKGKLLIQVEHYIDTNPQRPQAYANFLTRMAMFEGELDNWKTVVFDSVTFMELMARKDSQYRLNPNSREPRQWFAASTDALEEMLMIRVGSLPMNVVVIAHIDEDKDEVNGVFVRNPKAPGRLGKGKGLAAAMVEVYRMYVGPDGEGGEHYLVQTQSNGSYNCATRINAPNPCEPVYANLWANEKRLNISTEES